MDANGTTTRVGVEPTEENEDNEGELKEKPTVDNLLVIPKDAIWLLTHAMHWAGFLDSGWEGDCLPPRRQGFDYLDLLPLAPWRENRKTSFKR